MFRIIRNMVQCKGCGEILNSITHKSRITCQCGKVTIGGGLDSIQRLPNICADSYIEMSVIVDSNNRMDLYRNYTKQP